MASGTNLSSYVGTVYTDPANQFWQWAGPADPKATGSGSNKAYVFDGANPQTSPINFSSGLFGNNESSFEITGATASTITITFNNVDPDLLPDLDLSGTYKVLGLNDDVILMSKFYSATQSTIFVAITPTSPAIDPNADYAAAGYFQPIDDNGTYDTVRLDASWASDGRVYTPPPQTAAAPCFVAGTLIATERGAVAVEDLRPGDMVARAAGGLARVVWVGRRVVAPARHPEPSRLHPVLIAADAFAPGVPLRDLYVSPDHAVFSDDALIPAISLCNGVTVRQVARTRVAYHHVETAPHDVILAEGLPVETYLDMGNRRAFEGPGMMLHPEFGGADHAGCAPRLGQGEMVRAVRARLIARVAGLGFTVADAPDLHLLVDGRRVDSASGRFALPGAARDVRIVSRRGVASHVCAESEDDRLLGVALDRLLIETADGACDVLASPALSAGWHEIDTGLRWTDGDAVVPTGLLIGAVSVRVGIVGAARYWNSPSMPSPAVAG